MYTVTITAAYNTRDGSNPRTFTGDTMYAVLRTFVHTACKELPDYFPADHTFADVSAWYVQHGYNVTISYQA